MIPDVFFFCFTKIITEYMNKYGKKIIYSFKLSSFGSFGSLKSSCHISHYSTELLKTYFVPCFLQGPHYITNCPAIFQARLCLNSGPHRKVHLVYVGPARQSHLSWPKKRMTVFTSTLSEVRCHSVLRNDDKMPAPNDMLLLLMLIYADCHINISVYFFISTKLH